MGTHDWAHAGVAGHTAGALSLLDWGLVGLAAVVVVWAFSAAVRYTLWPGETDPDHVKRRVLVDEVDEEVPGR
jgi:hypothetical protein